MKSKKKSLFHCVTAKLSVVTICEVHLLSVSQPLIGLQKQEVFKVFVRHFCLLVGHHQSCAAEFAPQQHLMARRHSYAKRAPSAVATGQAAILADLSFVECKYCSTQLCDEPSCFSDLKMNFRHLRDGDTKAHDTTVGLSLKA